MNMDNKAQIARLERETGAKITVGEWTHSLVGDEEHGYTMRYACPITAERNGKFWNDEVILDETMADKLKDDHETLTKFLRTKFEIAFLCLAEAMRVAKE